MIKRTPAQNEARRLRNKTITQLTGNKELGRKARDWSNETYNRRVKELYAPKVYEKYRLPEYETVKVRSKKSKTSIDLASKFDDIPLSKINTIDEKQFTNRRERYKVFYGLIRKAGYTPKEAKKLMTKKSEDLAKRFKANKVMFRDDRKRRWKSLSKKGKNLDKEFIDLAEQVNIDNGFDINSRYGYGAVYAWYINGGDIKQYILGLTPDSQVPDIYYGMSKYNY